MGPLDQDEPPPPADWITTYGDMMSLLLTFFIMLVAMGDVKKVKYEAAAESIRRGFGFYPTDRQAVPAIFEFSRPILENPAQEKERPGPDSERGRGNPAGPPGDYPRVLTVRPGNLGALGGTVYFDDLSSNLSDRSLFVLGKVAEILAGKTQRIEIRGHTSHRPLPPDSPYKSRWDLAYDRCLRVLQYLVDHGINLKRIRIGLCADNEPLPGAEDPASAARNARVEIFLLDEFAENILKSGDAQPSAPAPAVAPAASPLR